MYDTQFSILLEPEPLRQELNGEPYQPLADLATHDWEDDEVNAGQVPSTA